MAGVGGALGVFRKIAAAAAMRRSLSRIFLAFHDITPFPGSARLARWYPRIDRTCLPDRSGSRWFHIGR
jgi:hypothetical protein